jgi:hypothetical protein
MENMNNEAQKSMKHRIDSNSCKFGSLLSRSNRIERKITKT